jgi:DNA polymerase I-like protein with 3'-5' exonuclease and polymerase domains
MGKLGEMLEASAEDTKRALSNIMDRYQGFLRLKNEVFPRDIRRGWFEGLDGRKVTIPNVGEKPHLVMSGYLQGAEALIMKKATLLWMDMLSEEEYDIVDLVHDEWQVECANDMDLAKKIGQAQCVALRKVGEELKLNCPLAGSFYNKKKQDYTIGTNWRVTH